MPAKLFSKTGPFAGASFWITDEAAIGQAELNDITLAGQGIRDYHARIYRDESGARYMLEDVAGGGLELDGMPVGAPVGLSRLSVITFANRFDFVFQETVAGEEPREDRSVVPGAETRIGGPVAPLPGTPDPGIDDGLRTRHGGGPAPVLPEFGTPPTGDDPARDSGLQTRHGGDPAPLPPRLPHPLSVPPEAPEDETVRPPDSGPPVLVIMMSTGQFREFALKPGQNVIGRAADCDVHIDDTSLSRRHAAVVLDGDRIVLRDLGSKNGTFVDEERVSGDHVVQAGQAMRFGQSVEANLRST